MDKGSWNRTILYRWGWVSQGKRNGKRKKTKGSWGRRSKAIAALSSAWSCGGMSTARKHTWAELRLHRQHHPARALRASAAFAVLGRTPTARTPVPGRCLEQAATSRRISVRGSKQKGQGSARFVRIKRQRKMSFKVVRKLQEAGISQCLPRAGSAGVGGRAESWLQLCLQTVTLWGYHHCWNCFP